MKIYKHLFIVCIFLSCHHSECKICTKTIGNMHVRIKKCENGHTYTCTTDIQSQQQVCDTINGDPQSWMDLRDWSDVQESQGWDCDWW